MEHAASSVPACRDMLHYRVGRHFQDRFDMGLNVLPWRRYGALRAPRESAIPVGRVRASSKPLAAVFSIVMLAVVASPIVENWKTPAHDDFPLSYYRMFSEERADLQRITYLVGIDTQGSRFLIPYRYAGAGGMNQVRRQMNKLVAEGDARRLCQTVASRVARARSRLPDLRTVEVTTGAYRLSEYFTGRQAPVTENVNARCSVARS